MSNKRLKIDNLDQDYLKELTNEEISSLSGGMTVAQLPEERIIKPDFPTPRPYPIPCTLYPTKGGKLPWCAVIL
ncbi:MAG: hypothetical protein Tsb0014_32190 [Pleurocapsa sp.]